MLLSVSRKTHGSPSAKDEALSGCQLGVRYESTGKPLEAISEYQKAVELSDGDLDATASLAHAFAVIGRRVEAKKVLGDLVRAKIENHLCFFLSRVWFVDRLRCLCLGADERSKISEVRSEKLRSAKEDRRVPI